MAWHVAMTTPAAASDGAPPGSGQAELAFKKCFKVCKTVAGATVCAEVCVDIHVGLSGLGGNIYATVSDHSGRAGASTRPRSQTPFSNGSTTSETRLIGQVRDRQQCAKAQSRCAPARCAGARGERPVAS
jgi:hypothetical protein